MPTAEHIPSILSFQEHSVVSRVLLKNKGGNVTLFAFDRDEGLSEHTAPFDALVVVLDGEAEVTIAGTPHRLRALETITMPANIPHALRALEPFRMLLVMLRE